MNTRVGLILVGGLTVAIVVASGPAVRKLYVNGKASTKEIKSDAREIYVPLSALKEAGAEVSVTDSRVSVQFKPMRDRLQTDAIEGVKDEWVQNATWRVRVSNVTKITNPFGRGPGIQATVEMRNLTPKRLNPYGSGLDKIQVLDAAGVTLTFNPGSFKDQFTDLTQANGFKNEIKFGDPSNALKAFGGPAKILFLFRNSGGTKLQDIRIDLD